MGETHFLFCDIFATSLRSFLGGISIERQRIYPHTSKKLTANTLPMIAGATARIAAAAFAPALFYFKAIQNGLCAFRARKKFLGPLRRSTLAPNVEPQKAWDFLGKNLWELGKFQDAKWLWILPFLHHKISGFLRQKNAGFLRQNLTGFFAKKFAGVEA